MSVQKEIYEIYKKHILNHFEENRRGALAMKEDLEHSPLFWHGAVDRALLVPKIYEEETIAGFRRITETTYTILGKVIREYQQNAAYRALFPFPKEMEELILLPASYDGFLPIARFDVFYNDETGDFSFCEINTDGTAAMLRDSQLRRAYINNPAHQAVIREYELESMDLLDTWIKTFLDLYETWPKKKADPAVAIIDYMENATLRDFEEYARRFQDAGIRCEICDVRSLTYRDGVLYSPMGNPVDAIYRRAVTADVMKYYEESTDFLNAVRDDAVFMAGAFATQVVHSKAIFYILHHEMTKTILTEEERAFVKAHVPFTVPFTPEYISLEEVRSRKDEFMLKPMDSYGAIGVYAPGRKYDQKDWDALTEDLYGKEYICQEYCKQYLTENIDFAWGDGKWHPYMNMQGLYVYNGVFSGFLMRLGRADNLIVANEHVRSVPVFIAKGKRRR